jgi:hypothetical protein
MKPQALRNSKRTLHLALDPPGPLPALLIIRKQGRLPLNKHDGYLFHRVEATSTHEREISIELPSVTLPLGSFVKVFLEDDAAYREFIVHHPDVHRLRLR